MINLLNYIKSMESNLGQCFPQTLVIISVEINRFNVIHTKLEL